ERLPPVRNSHKATDDPGQGFARRVLLFDDHAVDVFICIAEEDMYPGVLTVSSRSTRHLKVCRLVERQVVVDDVADIANVHALAERRRGYHYSECAVSERP